MNQHSQWKFLKKVPKFDFYSQFFMSKIIRIFLNFFFIEEYQLNSTLFCLTLFDNFNFWIILLLKWCSSFDTSPPSKFNNYLWVCWFLGKNLSNCVPPTWKLHNLYCHILYNASLPSPYANTLYVFMFTISRKT